MKPIIRNLLAAILFAASPQTHAQGTLVYDQQSAAEPLSFQNPGVDFFNLQEDSPLTQSFIPVLSAIGFVQFEFIDPPNNGNNGATVYVNLWTGSPNINSATLLASTSPEYMPNGFGYGYGLTSFYFSTPITLTPGQTYYLQPVVLSGDDPWQIMVLTDTYSNGQLFANGYPFDRTIDFWFREGIDSVPEPSTLALVGLGGLLFFVRKRFRKILPGLAPAVLLISLLAGPPARANVYYLQSLGGVTSPPFPFNPDDSSVPVVTVSSGVYVVEDGAPSGGGFHAMDDSGPPSLGEGGGSGTNGVSEIPDSLPVYTNGLWLEILNDNSSNLSLRLHGTAGGDNYQLLSTTNLSGSKWDLGQILIYAADGQADFSPIPMTNSLRFFLVHHANSVMAIYDGPDSREPDSTNSEPGQAWRG